KEMVVGNALAFGLYQGNGVAMLPFLAAIVTAGITAFYMFRIVFLTFTGEPRDHHRYDHAHESPPAMTLPLVVLAALAIVAGGILPKKSEWFAARVSPDVIVSQYMSVHEKKPWTAEVAPEHEAE